MANFRFDTPFNLSGRDDWTPEERQQAYTELFASDLGRAVLSDLLVRHGITQPIDLSRADLSTLAAANGCAMVAWDIADLAGLTQARAGDALVHDLFAKMKEPDHES